MGPSANSRFAARQVCVLIVALLSAGKPLAPAQGARGETDAWPNVDEDPGGATHVARELLVLYEPGTPAETERDVVRRSAGRTLKDLPGKVRLVTFPAVRRARSGARERALQRKLEGLRNEPRVEAVDCNYVRRASFIPDDEKFGAQW